MGRKKSYLADESFDDESIPIFLSASVYLVAWRLEALFGFSNLSPTPFWVPPLGERRVRILRQFFIFEILNAGSGAKFSMLANKQCIWNFLNSLFIISTILILIFIVIVIQLGSGTIGNWILGKYNRLLLQLASTPWSRIFESQI